MTLKPSKLETAEPIHWRVLLVVHNPIIRSAGGRGLWQVLGWNDPDKLVPALIADLQACSHGIARFEIVERVESPLFPRKLDGFSYTERSYLECWHARRGFHQPDGLDYVRVLSEFEVVDKVNQGVIDEVWLMGFPYAGYYESLMVGPGAFWCNAPPLSSLSGYKRRIVVMGFNYERGVGEMLESFGHRAESIMSQVYAGRKGEANLWERFTRYDLSHPGSAEMGNVHFAPNSERDYDWGNLRYVPSRCEDWYNFPHFQGVISRVNAAAWGDGDIRAHHLWWFHHFPHVVAETDGIANNWWTYVVDPNRVA